jgi:predicted TIM-barrel fold metal-dependent hydrolase
MATADEVVAQMDENGVDSSLLVGFPFADLGLCRTVNDYVLEAVRKYPGRLAGLACVTPMPGAKAELERCLDAGLCGCGELAPDGQGFGDAASGGRGMAVLTGCLRERNRPLLVHASEPVGHQYPGKGRFTPEACFALARACPEVTIVFGHMGGGLFLYETMPEVRQTLTRVFYDTAAVPYLYGPEIYEVAVLAAGPEKFIFGSDFPLLPPSRYLDGLGRLTDSARAAVQGGNARRVYGP